MSQLITSYRPLHQRVFLSTFAMFARSGDTIDSVTVGPTTAGKPDNDPTTNWAHLGDVTNIVPELLTKRDEIMVPDPRGGSRMEVEEHVQAEFYNLTFDGLQDIALELLFGVDEITQGTPQTPHQQTNRYVRGWLKLQMRNRPGANPSDLLLMDLWTEIRLAEPPPIPLDGQVTHNLRCQRLVPTSGETINFPAVA